jgi:protochlorophyllide reductase
MKNDNQWTSADIPDQSGKIGLVTGGNSGLGYETVRALAIKGARVILASLDTARGHAARDRILQLSPEVVIELMQLDLASLASIRQFTENFKAEYAQLHILVNNAGIMATPYGDTVDGFEMQVGVNHLGHFALTGLLCEVLLNTPESRVVAVSSFSEIIGWMNLDNLMNEKSYNRWRAYGKSKLANLLFAYELQRRLKAAGAPTISLAAHPGIAASNLREDLKSRQTPFLYRIQGYFWELLTQSVEMGALPQLYAATALEVKGGEFYTPTGFYNLWGYPKKSRSSHRSYDERFAAQLWNLSEDLTGVKYLSAGGASDFYS